MRKNLLILFFWGVTLQVTAQIQITPYLPERICTILPNGICDRLSQKLTNIISTNNIKSSMGESRFILTCEVNVDSKDIVPTSPVKIAYVLDFNLYIGDGVDGVKYNSCSFKSKGIGESEEKAYLNALQNLNAQSLAIKEFIAQGKNRIINYYEDNKSKILSSIQAAVDGKEFDRAVYEACLVPLEVSYYEDVQRRIGSIQSTIVNNEASAKLTKARSIWAASQNAEAANEILDIISTINPSANCYEEANHFLNTISLRLEQVNDRQWLEYKAQKEHQREMDVIREKNRQEQSLARIHSSERIGTALIQSNERQSIARNETLRQIGIAYAQSQPKVVYRVNNWYHY